MKLKHLMSLLAVTLLVTPTILAQESATQDPPKQEGSGTVDYKEVIEDYLEATGGKMAYENITSLYTVATMSSEALGISGKVTITQSGGKSLMKMDMAAIGETMQGFDGTTAWRTSEMQGPAILEGEEREQMVNQFVVSPYLNLEKRFETIECTGTEKFNGENCHVIEMKNKDQKPIVTYFSIESKLIVGTKMMQVSDFGEIEIVTKIGDYKEVDGIKFAHTTTVELPQGMGEMISETEEIKVNLKVDNSVFELPEDIKDLIDE